MITYRNNLDVTPGGIPPVIHLNQYDDDFQLIFGLYTSVGQLTIQTGTTAEIRGTKGDNNGYTATASITGNAVTVTGHKQMTAVAGRNVFELVLTKSNKVLSTVNFILDVERAAMDADTIQSETVLRELNAIIAGAATATQAAEDASDAADRAEAAAQTLEIDDTLTQQGQAADAKKTGDEISALKSDLDDIKSELSGEETASGNVAHITKAASERNVKSLIVNITPLQSGSGDPSSSNVRTISGWTGVTITKWKKNMLTLIADGKVPSISNGALVTANGVRSDYIPAEPNTKYSLSYSGYFSGDSYVTYMFFYDRNKNYISYCADGNADRVTGTTPSNTAFIMARIGNVTDLSRVNWSQLEIASSPTEYEAKTENTYTVNWNSAAGTVYGGTLNVTTGELTVTHGYISSYSGQTINEPWISSKDVYAEGRTPSTGAQVVYPLDSASTYHLDPTTIPQSSGILNFTANNVGSVTVKCETDSVNVTLPQNVVSALLACFANVAWADDDGQTYYDALDSALNS